MTIRSLATWTLSLLILTPHPAGAADEPVFSGPQAGETLVPFKLNGVQGDESGRNVDILSKADGGPLVLVFVHQRTRPSFGLTNTVMRFAASRNKDGITGATIFLTSDATETQNWMKLVAGNFPKGVVYGISPDGQEGPGAYGLNRNVELTVLVGKEHKVTANFALVQPSVQADGPKIFQAIVDVLGGGDVPDVAQFSGQDRGTRMVRPEQDPQLRPLLTRVIKKDATAEQVDEAARAVEDYAAKNAATRQEIGRIGRRIIEAGKLMDYGTAHAQEYLQKWANEYAEEPAEADGKKDEPRKQDQ
jgi:hypothetical protein